MPAKCCSSSARMSAPDRSSSTIRQAPALDIREAGPASRGTRARAASNARATSLGRGREVARLSLNGISSVIDTAPKRSATCERRHREDSPAPARFRHSRGQPSRIGGVRGQRGLERLIFFGLFGLERRNASRNPRGRPRGSLRRTWTSIAQSTPVASIALRTASTSGLRSGGRIVPFAVEVHAGEIGAQMPAAQRPSGFMFGTMWKRHLFRNERACGSAGSTRLFERAFHPPTRPCFRPGAAGAHRARPVCRRCQVRGSRSAGLRGWCRGSDR